MLGAIIGDIAGSTFEFCNTHDYNFIEVIGCLREKGHYIKTF